VEKGTKKYKLDSQGNIINPDAAGAAAAPAAPAASPFPPAFGGGGSGSGGGGGFIFGSNGGSAAHGGGGNFAFGTPPAGGGFIFGGAPAGGGGGGGGFVFGGAAAAPAPGPKRAAEVATAPKAKRSRTNALRLTGEESGCVLIVGNGDCGQLGLGGGEEDVRDSLAPIRMSSLDAMRICQVCAHSVEGVSISSFMLAAPRACRWHAAACTPCTRCSALPPPPRLTQPSILPPPCAAPNPRRR
jgi:hypothetical protein